MTSIFYPLLISMLPPPLSPPPDLPPHPPPSSPTFRSVISIPPSSSRPINSLRSLCCHPPPPRPLVQPAPRPSVLRENVHVHRAHSRRNNHFFVPDNTRSASPASCKFSSSPDRRLRPPPAIPDTIPRILCPFFRRTFFRRPPFFYTHLTTPARSLPAPFATYCRTGRNRTDVDAAVFHLSVPRGGDDIFFGLSTFRSTQPAPLT